MSAFSLRRRLAVAGAAAALVGVALPVAAATAASAQTGPRPGTITSVAVPGDSSPTGSSIYLPAGYVYLGGSGEVYYSGSGLVGTSGTSSCTGTISSLPCDSLIGYGSSTGYFEIGQGTTVYWPGGTLYLGINQPTTGFNYFGGFHAAVVETPNPKSPY